MKELDDLPPVLLVQMILRSSCHTQICLFSLSYLPTCRLVVFLKTYQWPNIDVVRQVPGVAENRPSVLRGDCLRVSKSEDTVQPITVYTGYVHRVELDSVKLGFSKKYELE